MQRPRFLGSASSLKARQEPVRPDRAMSQNYGEKDHKGLEGILFLPGAQKASCLTGTGLEYPESFAAPAQLSRSQKCLKGFKCFQVTVPEQSCRIYMHVYIHCITQILVIIVSITF